MIESAYQLPNGGVANYHKVQEIRSVHPFTHTNVEINCYASEADYMLTGMPMWTIRTVLTEVGVSGSLIESVENTLISNDESPLKGGVIVQDNSLTLEAAQARAWVRMKAERARAEVGNFEFDGGMYQADVQRINGAATLATMALIAGKPYTVDWTLTDNTVRTLDGAKAMGLGVAVGKFVDGIYGKARKLRVDIAATKTVEEANAIVWPSNQADVVLPTVD